MAGELLASGSDAHLHSSSQPSPSRLLKKALSAEPIESSYSNKRSPIVASTSLQRSPDVATQTVCGSLVGDIEAAALLRIGSICISELFRWHASGSSTVRTLR